MDLELAVTQARQGDGQALERLVKAIQDDVCVVLSSGFTEREALDRFQGAGLAGAVQKPVKSKVLLERIHQAMGPK